jgi:hypothetical protein
MAGERILALDLASRTGIATGVAHETPVLSFVDFSRPGDSDADVFARAARWMGDWLQDHRPDIVVIEAPVPKYDKSLQQGIRGIVLGLAAIQGLRIIEVEVQTWRKYALGFGNYPGKVAKARCVELCQRLGWTLPIGGKRTGLPDHNSAEAAGIWLWACARVDPKNVIRHEPIFHQTTTRREAAE